MQHKAGGYILSCTEPYGRCAMTSLLGASDPHQAAKRAWQPAGGDVQTDQRYSRVERPQSIARRTHQHGPGRDSRGAVPAAIRFCLFFIHSMVLYYERVNTMQNEKIAAPQMVREYKIGNTTYVVKSHSRPDATEDAVSKVKRLIRNDLRKKPQKP